MIGRVVEISSMVSSLAHWEMQSYSNYSPFDKLLLCSLAHWEMQSYSNSGRCAH